MVHRRPVAPFLALIVILAVALPVTIWATNAQTIGGAPAAPTSVTPIVRDNHTVDVSWTLPPGSNAEYVWVFAFTATGQPVRLLQANADEPYKRFYVGTGKMLFLVSAANSAGRSLYTAGPIVDVPAGCSTADVCLTVDNAPTDEAQTRAAAGFQNSTSSWGRSLDSGLTSALQPTSWRVADPNQRVIVSQYTNSHTIMLSELWSAASSSHNGGYAAPPWNDWANYRAWVSATVTAANAGGWAPKYWDIANEPDLMSNPANPYFAPGARSSATPANLLRMMLVAYQAIKAADPAAKIVGPSFAEYQDSVNAPPDRPNIRTFLQFAAANGMQFDAVSWHEDLEQLNNYDGVVFPEIVSEHVERLRRQLAKYPALGNPALFINEYTHASTNMLAGWNVGFIGEIDQARVDQANRTCWTSCNEPSIDGLLTPTGSTYSGTTASYWVYRAYADMEGATRMDARSSMAWRFNGTATRDDATRTVRVLAGSHWGCAPSANPSCSARFDPGAMSASLNVAYPYASTAVVRVYKLPAGVGPIAGPALLSSVIARVVGGRVVLPVVGINDGDALSVVITPGS